MKSIFVVISWWSNCLCLKCIDQLSKYTHGFDIYVVQNGKSEANRNLLRTILDKNINEIPYDIDAAGEHYSVLEYLISGPLQDEEGVWFIDHDTFISEQATDFFEQLDTSLAKLPICLLTPNRAPLTTPSFWISPKRLPHPTPSFAPHPVRTSRLAKRPDLYLHQKELESPKFDTLVLAHKFLSEKGLASSFPLEFFPDHKHIGGLHILTWPEEVLIARSRENVRIRHDLRQTVQELTSFFHSCPSEWLPFEDHTLLDRLAAINEKI